MSVTKPSQNTTTYTYDAALNVTSVTLPASGSYVTTVFDADNRPCYQVSGASQSGLTCANAAQAGSQSWTYVPGSDLVATQTDSLGDTTTTYYGDLAFPNSPTEVVDPMGTMAQYSAYNDFGDVCVSGSVAPALGTSTQCTRLAGDTSTVYNALEQATSVTDPSGNTSTYAYTDTSYPTLATTSTNPLSAATTYAYDAASRLTTQTNPDGTFVSEQYDSDSRVTEKTDTNTVCSSRYPNNVCVGEYTYGYNAANEMLTDEIWNTFSSSSTYQSSFRVDCSRA